MNSTCLVDTAKATTTRTTSYQLGNTTRSTIKPAYVFIYRLLPTTIGSTDEQFAKIITCHQPVASILG